jgi:hypothetical protein
VSIAELAWRDDDRAHAVGSFQFAMTEREGAILAVRIPLWIVQLILPIGFAVVALRLIWCASEHWGGRIVVAVSTAIICGALWKLPVSAEHLASPALLTLLGSAVLGAPIFVISEGQ